MHMACAVQCRAQNPEVLRSSLPAARSFLGLHLGPVCFRALSKPFLVLMQIPAVSTSSYDLDERIEERARPQSPAWTVWKLPM